MAYRRIRLSGSPYRRGFTYGREAGDLLKKCILNYADIFARYTSLSLEEGKMRALSYLESIRAHSPQSVEEMRGIAEGAGVDFEDVLTLNCRSEIVLAQDGCTAVAVAPERGNATLLAQNWDWMKMQKDVLLLLEIEQKPLPTLLLLAEAGMLSGKGMNENGLGVCFNALSTGKVAQGVPSHVLLREVLNSSCAGEATTVVARTPRASSANLLIATPEECVNIEYSPDDFRALFPENGFIAHTNHFLSPAFAEKDLGGRNFPDTFSRLYHSRRLLNAKDATTVDDLKAVLRDHTGFPFSICAHESPRFPDRVCSIYSIVMDPSARTMWIASYPPCETVYEEVRFSRNTAGFPTR